MSELQAAPNPFNTIAPAVPAEGDPINVQGGPVDEPEVEQETPEVTHASILSDLLEKLEGVAHMGKSEIQAHIDVARAQAASL